MHRLAAEFRPDGENVNIHVIRDFTESEVDEYTNRKREHTRLRQRLSLLFIHDRNYQELQNYREEAVQTPNHGIHQLFEFNRLFMNYLSSAYSLREHLKTALKRDFGRSSQSLSTFRQFLDAMEQTHRSYAFYQDFRNFVQHCGFPVGNAVRQEDSNGARLHLKYSRDKLLEDYNKWDKSQLATWDEDEVDLSEVTDNHHAIVRSEFPVVILAEYGAEVDGNEAYFSSLHDEAREVDPSAVAIVVLEEDFGVQGGTITFDHVPTNPLGELGLVRPPQPESEA